MIMGNFVNIIIVLVLIAGIVFGLSQLGSDSARTNNGGDNEQGTRVLSPSFKDRTDTKQMEKISKDQQKEIKTLRKENEKLRKEIGKKIDIKLVKKLSEDQLKDKNILRKENERLRKEIEKLKK